MKQNQATQNFFKIMKSTFSLVLVGSFFTSGVAGAQELKKSAFHPVAPVLCPRVSVGGGLQMSGKDTALSTSVKSTVDSNLDKLLKLSESVLKSGNSLSEQTVGQTGDPTKLSTIGKTLAYIVAVVQNFTMTDAASTMQIHYLPDGACDRVIEWNKTANKSDTMSPEAMFFERFISVNNVPTMGELEGADKVKENVQKLLPYFQIAGLSLNLVNDIESETNKVKTNVSGSIAILLPRHFYWPIKDMYAMGGELHMEKFYFDEYDTNKHYIIIDFNNLVIVNQLGLLPKYNSDFNTNIYFTGDVAVKFSPVSRALTFLPHEIEKRHFGKPSYEARLAMKPTRLEKLAEKSELVRKILDNVFVLDLSVSHMITRVKTEVNPTTHEQEWYPELVLDKSIGALLGSMPGNYSGKSFLINLPVDFAAQDSINLINNQLHNVFKNFYTSVQESVDLFGAQVTKCGSNDSTVDSCVSSLKSELGLLDGQ